MGSSYRKNRSELDQELKFFKKEMDEFTNKDKFKKFNLVDCKFLKSFFILSLNGFKKNNMKTSLVLLKLSEISHSYGFRYGFT